MHNFMLQIFKFIKNVFHFMKIFCIFSILMLVCLWIQNIINANWNWLNFITPFLTWLLETANNIYSISFNLFGSEFEFKYISAGIILVALFYIMNLFIILTGMIEEAYKSAHYICKKTEEVVMNKNMQNSIEMQERKIKKYSILIQTQVKKKFSHLELNVNVDEQNILMNKFIIEQTGVQPSRLNDGFLYQFSDFNSVDKVLDVLFKLIKSTSSKLDYFIGIQVNDNLEQLQKIVSLKFANQVVMAADTSYRYKYNKAHRYQTSLVGVFQNNNTLELHEFKEIL